MNQALEQNRDQPIWRPLVAVGMMLLLLWLTSINFVYLMSNAPCTLITCLNTTGEDEESTCGYPGSPTVPDEKSPDAPISIIEEFIHEHGHAVNSLWTNMMFQHKVHEAEKLCVVHPESFSPPPEA